MELFRGIVAAIRNEKAHNNDNHLDYQTSLEWLNYISALLRVLERSEYIEKKQ
jgi:hypothetical protein